MSLNYQLNVIIFWEAVWEECISLLGLHFSFSSVEELNLVT